MNGRREILRRITFLRPKVKIAHEKKEAENQCSLTTMLPREIRADIVAAKSETGRGEGLSAAAIVGIKTRERIGRLTLLNKNNRAMTLRGNHTHTHTHRLYDSEGRHDAEKSTVSP